MSLSIDPERKGYDFNMSHGREDANDCHIDCLRLFDFNKVLLFI